MQHQSSAFFDSMDEYDKKARIEMEMLEEMESALAAYAEEAPEFRVNINRLRQQIDAAKGTLCKCAAEGSKYEPEKFQVIYNRYEDLRKRLSGQEQQKQEEASEQKAVPRRLSTKTADTSSGSTTNVVHEEPDRRGYKRKA